MVVTWVPCGLHDIHTLSPRACGPWAVGVILGKPLLPMLQLYNVCVFVYVCVCPGVSVFQHYIDQYLSQGPLGNSY